MNPLTQLVSQKTGLDEGKARMAVETVVGYFKEKLPPALSGQIDSVLQARGSEKSPEGLGDALNTVLKGK